MEAVHFKNYSVTAFISNKHTTVTIVYVGFHWLPSSFKSVFDLNISFHHLQSYSQYGQSFTPCYTLPMKTTNLSRQMVTDYIFYIFFWIMQYQRKRRPKYESPLYTWFFWQIWKFGNINFLNFLLKLSPELLPEELILRKVIIWGSIKSILLWAQKCFFVCMNLFKLQLHFYNEYEHCEH